MISRDYETRIWQLEERRVNGRWITSHREAFSLTPFYFDFYDSFNRPQSGGGKASGQEREFQKRSPVGLLGWFARRNLWRLASRAAVVATFIWVCFMGGMNWLIFRYMSFSNAMAKAQHKASSVSSTSAEPGKAAEKLADPKTGEVLQVIPERVQATGAQAALKAKESRADAMRIGRALGAGEQKDQAKTGGTKHGTREEPAYVLAGVSTDWAAMGDGRMLRAGEAVNEFELVRVEYRLRGAIFRVAGKEHLVCVGGSVRQ
jgi:hypothetical protein